MPRTNIHVGDALIDESFEFEEAPKNLIYFRVDDLGFSQVKIIIERNVNGKSIQQEFIVDYSKAESIIKQNFEILYKMFSLINEKNIVLCSEADKFDGRLRFINAFFKKYIGKCIEIKNPLYI